MVVVQMRVVVYTLQIALFEQTFRSNIASIFRVTEPVQADTQVIKCIKMSFM
jgi:hypothetical protein